MKKIKLVALLILSITMTQKIIAQEIDTTSIIQAYLNSDVIFEGIVEEICCYTDQTTGIIYTSNKVNITKIFKGNLECGTINIVTPGGQLNGIEVHVSHQTEFNVGVTGVFMCRTTSYPQPTCNFATNEIAMELTVAFQGTIEYLFDNVNQEVEGFQSYFNTLEEFYAFLSANGINIIDCNSSTISDLRIKNKLVKLPIEEITQREPNLKKSDESLLINKISISRQGNFSLGKTGEKIEPFISQLTKVNVGPTTYYDIEISVKSNSSSIYLDGLILRLKYNKNTFGTNISSVTTFTQHSDFPSTIYNYNVKSDYKDSILSFTIINLLTNPMRTQLNTTGKIIGTFRIPTTNCKNLANFKIDTISDFSTYTTFTTTQTAQFTTNFSSYLTGSFNAGSICQPTVSFISNNLSAGIGDILTIDGNNFGNVKGNISMQNADGMPLQIALDKYDVIQWNNTQIKIRVPSTVDSSDLNGTTYTKHPVGTGPITISDAYGGSAVTSSVTIKYAALNKAKTYSSGYSKTNCYLFSANTDGKYHFKLHANITDQKMIDCIYAAIRRWRCTTGLPFVIDPGTVTNNIAVDNINVIKMSTITDNTILIRTWPTTYSPCSNNATIPIPLFEMDIEISDNQPQFKFDTTGTKNIEIDSTDFFSSILHEIGHAIGLEHVLNNDMIMYPYAPTTAVLSNDRKIIVKNNDLACANYIINNSLTTPTGLTCQFNMPLNLQTTPCYWNNSMNDLDNNLKELVVYPNPFNSSISIEYNSLNKEYSTLALFDINGKKVYDNLQIETLIGKNTISLSDLDFNNGLYFISLFVDGKLYSYKISCIR
jgi:hypothetical protein